MGFSRTKGLVKVSCSRAPQGRWKMLLKPLVLQHLRKKSCCGCCLELGRTTPLQPQSFFFRKWCKTNGFSNIFMVIYTYAMLISSWQTKILYLHFALPSPSWFKLNYIETNWFLVRVSAFFETRLSKKAESWFEDKQKNFAKRLSIRGT